MSVRVDGAGNLIGRRNANTERAPILAIGSHLDTVPNAGKYDGILGVLSGIALVELTNDSNLPYAIEVVGFSEEEGVRFGRPYLGSHAYAGTLDPSWMALRDRNGVSVDEAIRAFGLDPAPLSSMRPRADLAAYLELHIEQGPVLEQQDQPIGVVYGIAAQTRAVLELRGNAAHAGTTPMAGRRDALAGAAEIIVAVETIALKHQLVATVGRINVHPNGSNVIAERAEFTIDVRSNSERCRDQAMEEILEHAAAIAQKRSLQFISRNRANFPAIAMNQCLFTELMGLAQKCSPNVPGLWSGAGHDAAVLAQVTPAAMIFLRNPGGISHSPLESVAEKDVAVALFVARDFLKRMIPMANARELESQ